MARAPETPAGSESLARMEMETPGTWEIPRGLAKRVRQPNEPV